MQPSQESPGALTEGWPNPSTRARRIKARAAMPSAADTHGSRVSSDSSMAQHSQAQKSQAHLDLELLHRLQSRFLSLLKDLEKKPIRLFCT